MRLTHAQEAMAAAIEDQWLAAAVRTGPAEREAAEIGVRAAYSLAGLEPPAHVLWFGSPRAGAAAVALMTGALTIGPDSPRWCAEVYDELRRQGWAPEWDAGRSVRRRVRTEPWAAARKASLEALGPDGWAQLSAAAGRRSWGLVMDLIAGRMRVRLGEDLGPAMRTALLDAIYGQHDGTWLSTFEAAGRLAPPADPAAGPPGNAAGPAALGSVPGDAPGSGALGGSVAPESGAVGAVSGLATPESGAVGAVSGPAVVETEMVGAVSGPAMAASDAVGVMSGPAAGLAGLAEVARHAGWWWAHERVAVLTERPVLLERDNVGRMHRGEGPAMEFPDGYGLWAWRGMPIPSELAAELPVLTVERIRAEGNAEIRRVMLEHFGYERYLREAGARKMGSDETGTLWWLDLPGDEPLVMVEVINSTPEPDGTSRIYWLRVPPRTPTARAGVAWTFGLTEEEYRPLIQT